MSVTFTGNVFTRITAADTWTEVAGATKGLAGAGAGDNAELDVYVQNFDAANVTVHYQVTPTSTAPTSDDDTFATASLAENGTAQLAAILTGTEHLWIKNDGVDLRVNVSGTREDN